MSVAGILRRPKPWFAQDALAAPEARVALVALVATIAIIPYCNVAWPGSRWHSVALLALGSLCALAALSFLRHVGASHVALTVPPRLFTAAIVAGVSLQLLLPWLARPHLTSDFAAYLQLADELAHGRPYVDTGGFRAFWPPGLPLFLAPFVWLLGNGIVAVAVANLTLSLVGMVAVHRTAARLFSIPVARLAVLLFLYWPSRLLIAALPGKENLTSAMVLAFTALLLSSTSKHKLSMGTTVLAGACLGVAGLAQPGLLLLAVTAPLAFRHWLRKFEWRSICAWLLSLLVGFAVVVAPWAGRNCHVFEGRFCGIATNGGSVFYRSNNPLATGLWTPRGVVRLDGLPELDQNRRGTELALEWIRANPVQAFGLALKKFTQLMGTDDYGSYWAIFRASGTGDRPASDVDSTSREQWYRALALASLLFWYAICAAAAATLLRRRVDREGCGDLLPLVYPLLYTVGVFCALESGSRQHMPAGAELVILAAGWFDAACRAPARIARQSRCG